MPRRRRGWSRWRPRPGEDSGAGLVELLVVLVVLGVLAAIAVPTLQRQRVKAADAALTSDLVSAAMSVESWFVDHRDYPDGPRFEADVRPQIRLSPGNVLSYTAVPAGGFCLVATRAPGAAPASHPWVYLSAAGGVQPGSVTDCSS